MQHWIYRASLDRFRLHDFIRDYGFVEYLQKGDIQEGDIVYLYLTAPYKRVEYKMFVERANIPCEEQFDDTPYSLIGSATTDDPSKKVIRFRFIDHVQTDELCYQKLRKHGFRFTIQSDRKIDGEIVDYIESFFDK